MLGNEQAPASTREARLRGLGSTSPPTERGEHMDIALGLLQGVVASLLACIVYDLAKAIARRIRRR